jgi:preprotein translocase subunit SecY
MFDASLFFLSSCLFRPFAEKRELKARIRITGLFLFLYLLQCRIAVVGIGPTTSKPVNTAQTDRYFFTPLTHPFLPSKGS